MKYDVFLSYSRKDYVDDQKNVIPGNVVSRIKDALTNAGISYWFDEEGIYFGQNFVEKIVSNIESSEIFVFLSSENANKSRWTCKEIASADELRKHIIPVRIDKSPYNRKVLFRISDLDYIEYYINPEKGVNDLIKAIKTHLEILKNDELRKKKEEETKRQEQNKLIDEIKLSCSALNNEEAKLELNRENLLLSTEKIDDEAERDELKRMINDGGIIHEKYQKKYDELLKQTELQKSHDLKPLQNEIETQKNLISKLQYELENSNSQEKELQVVNDSLNKQIDALQKDAKTIKRKFLTKALVVGSILLLIVLIFGGIMLYNANNEYRYLEERYSNVLFEQRKSNRAKETLDELSKGFPFIIKDLNVEYLEDSIEGQKSSFVETTINYYGLNEGTYNIEIKLFDTFNGRKYLNKKEVYMSLDSIYNSADVSYNKKVSFQEGNNRMVRLKGKCYGNLKYHLKEPYLIEIWVNGEEVAERFTYIKNSL